MVHTNINDSDDESTFNCDDDYLYDHSRENTGTDIFTLNYKHIDIHSSDQKIYHLYDNYFDHINEQNIMDTIINFLAEDNIIDVFNFRCVDKYSRDCIDDEYDVTK